MDAQEIFMENQTTVDSKTKQIETETPANIKEPKSGAVVDGPVQTQKKRATDRPAVGSISAKKIRVIGVPLDLGQSRRGVDMGPSAVRVAGLEARLEALGHIVEDGGNITVALAETKKAGDPSAKYLKEITATCTKQ